MRSYIANKLLKLAALIAPDKNPHAEKFDEQVYKPFAKGFAWSVADRTFRVKDRIKPGGNTE